MQDLPDGFHLRLVATAHPTNIFRRTILEHRRILLDLLRESFRQTDPLPEPTARLLERVAAMHRTHFARWGRPRVIDEVHQVTGYFVSALWSVAVRIQGEAEETAGRPLAPVVSFGSWAGGDMDGNPHVDATTFAEALALHRATARSGHAQALRAAARHLTQELGGESLSAPFRKRLEQMLSIGRTRRLVLVRGGTTSTRSPSASSPISRPTSARSRRSTCTPEPNRKASYRRREELVADLSLLTEELERHGHSRSAALVVRPLHRAARIFGFHLASLDLREDSRHVRRAAAAILQAMGVDDLAERLENPQATSWERRRRRSSPDASSIAESLILPSSCRRASQRTTRPSPRLDPVNCLPTTTCPSGNLGHASRESWTPSARSSLDHGPGGAERFVLTMASSPLDTLSALLLLRQSGLFRPGLAGRVDRPGRARAPLRDHRRPAQRPLHSGGTRVPPGLPQLHASTKR